MVASLVVSWEPFFQWQDPHVVVVIGGHHLVEKLENQLLCLQRWLLEHQGLGEPWQPGWATHLQPSWLQFLLASKPWHQWLVANSWHFLGSLVEH